MTQLRITAQKSTKPNLAACTGTLINSPDPITDPLTTMAGPIASSMPPQVRGGAFQPGEPELAGVPPWESSEPDKVGSSEAMAWFSKVALREGRMGREGRFTGVTDGSTYQSVAAGDKADATITDLTG